MLGSSKCEALKKTWLLKSKVIMSNWYILQYKGFKTWQDYLDDRG